MSTRVGITTPKMLPIVGTWLVPYTAYLFLLSVRISKLRLENNKMLGDKLSEDSPGDADKKVDPLQVAVRSHNNFLENVPYGLLAAAVVELNGGDRRVLTGGLAALLLFRVLHVEFGMNVDNATGVGKKIGHGGTGVFLAGMSTYALYLVKGYWGL